MPQSKPIVLDYASPKKLYKDNTRRLFLFLAFPSLIVPFIPFAMGTPPSHFGFWTMSGRTQFGALFYALPILLLKTRKHFLGGRLTTLEHTLAYGLAAYFLGIGCWRISFFASHLTVPYGSNKGEIIPVYVLCIVVLALCLAFTLIVFIALLLSASGRRVASEASLLGAYVTHAVLCLFMVCYTFPFRGMNIGWYLTCFVVAVFVADMVHLVAKTRKESKMTGDIC